MEKLKELIKEQGIEAIEKAIAELKSKPTPEQRFLEIINGLTVKIDIEKYPNSTFLFNGDDCYFELEKSTLWCRYGYVWRIFEKEFSMDYDDTQSFIVSMVEKYFKMKGVTPLSWTIDVTVVEKYFKMKGVTP